jgi:hypothetical protein
VPARIRFIGHVDVYVDVPGVLLPLVLPSGLRLDRLRREGSIEIQLRPENLFSTFVGRLSVPHLVGGRVRLAALDVPPPAPWSWGDIRTMLSAVRRLGLPDPASAGALHRGAVFARPSRHALAWEALNRCSSAASAALSRWPSRSVRHQVHHPLELSRGTELIDVTERQLGQGIDLLRAKDGRLAPVVTARRVRQVEPWTNRSIATVAGQVCQVVRSAKERSVFGEAPPALTAPIRALSHRSRPSVPVPDPPFSSWPPVFSDAYLASLAVLNATTEGGRQSGWVPLSDLWRLYETWLAERSLAILRRILGGPAWTASDAERVTCGWHGDGWELELRHPCTFTSKPRELVGCSWWSVSSELEPDVVLVANGPAGPRLVALDAKARGRITPGDLAPEASKYLWGIRRDHDSTFGVTAVVLVSPYGGDEPYNRAASAQWTVHGHPHAGPGAAPGMVGTELTAQLFLDLLIDKLELPLPR